jgi:DNA mismatch repair protein MSH4
VLTSLQANYNRLLDVARETYRENVDDIFALTKALVAEHDLPLTIVWQNGEFVFVVKTTEHEGELPASFINVTKQKGRWVFTSMNLVCTQTFGSIFDTRAGSSYSVMY